MRYPGPNLYPRPGLFPGMPASGRSSVAVLPAGSTASVVDAGGSSAELDAAATSLIESHQRPTSVETP